MSSEHVEVLRHMKETIRAIMPSEVAALDAAIAALSAPQPPAEAQPVAPMTGDLLPCPFCGAPAERIDFGPGDAENEGGSCIACTRCQSSGPVEFGRKENFVANWNCRTPPPSAPVGVEDGPIDASDNAEYIEYCADRLERCGLRVTAGALRVIAQEHRALAQKPAAVDGAMVGLAKKARELQKRYYGNGIGLHLSMISWAQEYDALAAQPGGSDNDR